MNFDLSDFRKTIRRTTCSAFAALSFLVAGHAEAADRVVYQLSWLPTGFYVALSAGLANGLYADEDIELTVRTGRGSGDAVKKVAGGGAEFGDGDFSAVILGRVRENSPTTCLMHVESHSSHSLFTLKSSGIQSFKDLEGKTLATSAGNSNYNYFPIVARMAGLDPDSVSWQTVDNAALASLLVNKSVDAVPFFTSNASFIEPMVIAAGEELVILPFFVVGFDIYGYCIYAHDSVINERPDLVKRFVSATVKSYLWAQKNPEEAARLHTERWPDTKYEDNLAAWEDLRTNMFGRDDSKQWTGRVDMDKLQRTYDAVAEANELDRDFDVGVIVNNDFLPK